MVYNLVIEKGLWKLKGAPPKIHIDSYPRLNLFIFKPHPDLYTIRLKFEAEPDRLHCEGIIERVQYSTVGLACDNYEYGNNV